MRSVLVRVIIWSVLSEPGSLWTLILRQGLMTMLSAFSFGNLRVLLKYLHQQEGDTSKAKEGRFHVFSPRYWQVANALPG